MCDNATSRSTIWNLANNLWKKRNNAQLPSRLGDILGCSLVNFKSREKPDRGKNRLYQILVSESAYLIWKIRNERRIRDNDTTVEPTAEVVKKRWTNAINKRLTIDRFLTDENRFRKKAIDKNLVKRTWARCLKDEERLPPDWHTNKGVLVGIS